MITRLFYCINICWVLGRCLNTRPCGLVALGSNSFFRTNKFCYMKNHVWSLYLTLEKHCLCETELPENILFEPHHEKTRFCHICEQQSHISSWASAEQAGLSLDWLQTPKTVFLWWGSNEPAHGKRILIIETYSNISEKPAQLPITYHRGVVSLSKTLYSPKVLVNYPGSGGSIPTWLKNCWLGR